MLGGVYLGVKRKGWLQLFCLSSDILTKLYIYLVELGLSWGTWFFSCSIWDLLTCLGMEPRLCALGVWSLSH